MSERNFKLLIVDDEAEIREGILQAISWEEQGITVAGLASNGREALQMITQIQPDLMLLDIRMPVMNGLELLERLAEDVFPIKIIIISGYDDFGYCQQALRHGVSDYLLKPCHPQEILTTLVKLKNQIIMKENQSRVGPGEPAEDIEEPFIQNRNLAKAENRILHCLWTRDLAGLTATLDSFFAHLSLAGPNSKNYIQKMMTALICLVHHACLERGIRTETIFGPNLAILDELPRIAHLHQLHERIGLCFKQIIALHPLQNNQWKMVIQAVNYIEDHYAEDLHLDRLAKIVLVSPGYLSTSFKQVLRKNFVDYVTEVRIRKAQELLKDFHLKIYEIAVQTGYKDEKYFSTIFKKTTGMSPNQYRDSITN